MKTRKHFITVLPSGYGHWRVESTVRGKKVSAVTHDSELIDRYNDLKNDRIRGIIAVENKLHRIAVGN